MSVRRVPQRSARQTVHDIVDGSVGPRTRPNNPDGRAIAPTNPVFCPVRGAVLRPRATTGQPATNSGAIPQTRDNRTSAGPWVSSRRHARPMIGSADSAADHPQHCRRFRRRTDAPQRPRQARDSTNEAVSAPTGQRFSAPERRQGSRRRVSAQYRKLGLIAPRGSLRLPPRLCRVRT